MRVQGAGTPVSIKSDIADPMVSVKTVVAGPEKTGLGKTVIAGPEWSDRSVVVGTFPIFY